MDRRRFSPGVRKFVPVVVIVAVLGLLAGVLPVLVAGPDSSPRHGALQAPGSNGSVHSVPWWDPKGWFGGGGGAPAAHAIAGYKPAVGRPPGHVAGQGPRKPAHRVRQLPARDGYTQVYRMSDGTEQAVVSAGPVNYRTPAGGWAPISTAVRPSAQPGYSYQNTTNGFQSFFGSAAGQLVRFDAPGGGWVTIGVSGARSPRPAVRGDTVTYAGVAPGVSLSYQVTPQSLKERIILASPAAASALASLRFTVRAGGGLTPAGLPDGSIALTRDGVPVLTLPKPFMTDATRSASSPYGFAWSPKVAQHATWDPATHTMALSVSADSSWLRQPVRRFPVTVDPTIVVSPTPTDARNVMIESDAATTNFSTIWRLSVGTSAAGVERSLLWFPLGAVPSGTQLTSASLRLYYDQTFGPGTANQTVQVDQATAAWSPTTATWSNASNNVGTAGPSLSVNPNVDNIWDNFTVTPIVQSWLSGTKANNGFVVKAANESALNVGGPRYEASFNGYNGEVITYPQLVLTYGVPGVTPNPITTIHATGAELSWSGYTDPTPSTNPGDDLASYQVHRSVFQSFIPAANTLVATVPSGKTTFTDTTNTPTPPGGLGNAFYYMIAVKTKDGTVIPGPVQIVRLPTAGSTLKIVPATGATSLSSAQPTTVEQHITGQPWTSVGDDSATFGTTRSVFSFPSMASAGIPADATVSAAHLQLWGFFNDMGAPTAAYDAYELTQSFTPSQATWNNAATGVPWTTAGGAFSSTLQSQVTDLNPDPSRHNWEALAAVRDWVATPSHEHGLIVKLDSSAVQERELFTDTTAPEPSLRPSLVVTYTEPAPEDTYYAPSLPDPMSSNTSYTIPVTLTNTTASTWSASDWVLSYHWLAPDGTDLSTSANQVQTALPAAIAPSAVATVNASVKTPDTSASGDARAGYQLAWDLFNKTTGTWLSSGTSTPVLSAAGATRLGGAAKAGGAATAPDSPAAPMAAGNNTVATLKQAASVELPSSNQLGLEKFYQYTGINTGAGGSILNNAYAGNTVWNYNAFSNPSRGFQTFVRISYNSMDTSSSAMGFGWSLQASSLMRLGTPLDFHPNPNPTTVTLTDGDGTSHLFTKHSDGTWASPPGVHYYLQQNPNATCSANGKDPSARAWLLTAPDRTQFWFDCQGYQTAVIDKNGNEADFTYTQRNSNNQPREFLDYITDPAGRQTLTINYYNKGDNYSYVDDTGAVTQGTNLTDPDIIDQVKSISAFGGDNQTRTITFLYDTKGLMCRMTDGDGTAAAKVFKFGYDPTQGNKNVKLVSVTDPRGNATGLAYYTAPQDPKFKWSLKSVSDRMQRTTGFAYTEPGSGQIQTVVTDPKTNTTTYLMDSSGRPVQSTNAKNQVTKLGYDSDNNVTSLTEDNGAQTTWTYDPNTGYPLTMKDAQANHDGTAGTTYTYQKSPDGHVADLTSKLTPQQRLWTFGYDANGNLKTVTKPLGNAAGAVSGSYTSRYDYYPDGTLKSSTDPNGNITGYSDYDASGNPQQVTDPACSAKRLQGDTCNSAVFVYNLIGQVTSQTDPLQTGTSTDAYDVFGRPLQSTVPKTATTSITTPAPVYDGNDNVTQSTAANGAVTTSQYDADDELTMQVTPPDTSSAPSPTTTYDYDADGNLKTVTKPLGNIPGATPGSYTTTNGYDPINELTSVLDPMQGLTQYGYDDVGNQKSITSPVCSAKPQGSCQPATTDYNLNHKVTQVTDPAGNTTKTHYDLDGLVDKTTDQNNNETLYTLDADGQVTQAEVSAQAPGQPVSYDVTQVVYDQDGNQTQLISPRGVAAGVSNSSSCVQSDSCAFTQVTKYNADSQVKTVLSPFNPSDPVYNTPAETDYSYDADGRLMQVSAPPSGTQTIRDVTNYTYYDTGWVQSETDPTAITTSYDYNALGEQSSRVLTSAGGAMSRAMSWDYYPDGNLKSVSDNGVPTGLYAEVVDDSDAQAAESPAGSWTTVQCTSSTVGCEGYEYRTHAAGTGTDKFTWQLNVPQDGNYTVYVKYPVVSGAVKNASYTVDHSGGSATVTADQTQDNNGGWVALGKWAFTKGAANQQVSLAENSSGSVVAGAVEIVRDNAGDTNTATRAYAYSYDADGNQTGITDSSPGAAITQYMMGYDQLDRNTSVEEDNSSGTAVHTTSYGYDPDSDQTSQVHDGAPSTYDYNSLDQLSKETDAKSSTDTNPQITSFPSYTPTGQVATEVKPNGNTVTSAYYANGLLDTQTEDTSGGTLVSSDAYKYDQDGNRTQDIQKLMSADNSADFLSHTLTYAYDPMDRIQTVATDGTVTESYAHDGDGNVISQTIGGTTISYGYNLGRLQTATTGGTTADYNYDPLGRLDTVTSGGQTIQSDSYDGFDNLSSVSQLNTATGALDTTSYAYDSLGRVTSQTTTAGTSSFSYLGLSGELASESDPGGRSKTYAYTPGGMRLFQTTTGGGTSTPGYYTYNSHYDVEAVTGASGTTTATYGYSAYGNPVTGMFTGADKNNAQPSQTTQPYSSYRFNAMRWDSGTGQYDMGFRTYDPGLNQFTSRDMYDGALANMGLTTDPFTGSRYAFGSGNPITNIELDGHSFFSGFVDNIVHNVDSTVSRLLGNSGAPIKPVCTVDRLLSTACTGCSGVRLLLGLCTPPPQQNDGIQPGQGNIRFNIPPVVCAGLTAGMGIPISSCPVINAASGGSGSTSGSGGLRGFLGRVLQFLGFGFEDAADRAAFDYATTPSKLDHIFAAKHNFGPLVQQFGSREAVVRQFLNALKGLTPKSGTFEEQIFVGGQKVIVRGAVVNGVTKIGTAFTP